MSTKDLDLRFRYRGGSPIVASEGCRLAEEERGILLEVLSRHFERSEPGAFTFDWFDPATLSPLQRFQRDGSGAQSEDSQKMARELGVLLSTPDRPIGDLTEDEKRLVLIREVVGVLIREVRSMSREGVPTRLAATHPDRPGLVDHFLSLDLAHPSSPFDAMSAAGESIRKTMREDLGREPTHDEWRGVMWQTFVLKQPLPARRPSPSLAETDTKPRVPPAAVQHHVTLPQPPAGTKDTESQRPIGADLAAAAGISDDTFRRIREAAGIVQELKGGAARGRRYTAAEVDRLIIAVRAGDFMERNAAIEKWQKWSSAGNAVRE